MTKEFDPFAQDPNDIPVLGTVKVYAEKNKNIAEPLSDKVSLLDSNPYKNHQYINEAWHNPSHGININNEKALASFLNDIESSSKIWKESGVYLGFILQAVEGNTVIDMGVPIGLIPDVVNYEQLNHVTTEQTKDIIKMYREYLAETMVGNTNDISIEVKPFYAINNYKINYDVVEESFNKRIKI